MLSSCELWKKNLKSVSSLFQHFPTPFNKLSQNCTHPQQKKRRRHHLQAMKTFVLHSPLAGLSRRPVQLVHLISHEDDASVYPSHQAFPMDRLSVLKARASHLSVVSQVL